MKSFSHAASADFFSRKSLYSTEKQFQHFPYPPIAAEEGELVECAKRFFSD